MRFDPVTFCCHPRYILVKFALHPSSSLHQGKHRLVGWSVFFSRTSSPLDTGKCWREFWWHKWSTLTLWKNSGWKVRGEKFEWTGFLTSETIKWINCHNQIIWSWNPTLQTSTPNLFLYHISNKTMQNISTFLYFSSHHHSGPQNWISSSWMIHRELPMPRIPQGIRPAVKGWFRDPASSSSLACCPTILAAGPYPPKLFFAKTVSPKNSPNIPRVRHAEYGCWRLCQHM